MPHISVSYIFLSMPGTHQFCVCAGINPKSSSRKETGAPTALGGGGGNWGSPSLNKGSGAGVGRANQGLGSNTGSPSYVPSFLSSNKPNSKLPIVDFFSNKPNSKLPIVDFSSNKPNSKLPIVDF